MKIKNKKREVKAKDLAQKYGISVSTVKKYFSQDREDYIKENALRRAEMYKLKLEGWTLEQIGKKYGTTKNNVSLLIKKHKQQYANQLNLI
ncbi:hypothetical protein GQ597_11830 [Gilliamella sp. Pra-s65]|uniref:hypothetical protein n=1 Tax=Gilliamella sp. Pra-s65 TaxID=2687316 RepID=UPI001366456A|nr:hypothetical protein [Gilliamella sp. Pra-s65]MWN91383.1 hypothetical protein [Gilliamella sp. Pra-s65]